MFLSFDQLLKDLGAVRGKPRALTVIPLLKPEKVSFHPRICLYLQKSLCGTLTPSQTWLAHMAPWRHLEILRSVRRLVMYTPARSSVGSW